LGPVKASWAIFFLLPLALAFSSCQAATMQPFEAYLPLKIEVAYSYTQNFSLTVQPSLQGSKWREIKDNTYMAFECAESRDTFLILFEITYPQPVEQLLVVQFSEGKRPVRIEAIQYASTGSSANPQATRRELPSSKILLRFWVRTTPEPTDPNYVVELLRQREKADRDTKEANDERRHREVMNLLGIFGTATILVTIACIVVIALKRDGEATIIHRIRQLR